MTDDLISRKAAIEALGEEPEVWSGKDEYEQGLNNQWHYDVNAIKAVPSVQRWNVIHKRPMTDEEHKEWSERLGYDIEYDEAYIYSNLPDDGQEVFVSAQYGRVYVDTFCQDDGCYFEENGDMDGILAWMPLPEPYKEGNND